MTDKIICAVTLVLAGVYFYATSQIPSLEIGDPLGPKAFPILLGIILVLAAILLAVEIYRAKAPPPGEAVAGDFRHLWLICAVFVWTALYFWVFDRAGYIVSTVIYLLALTIVFNRGKWVANILTSILFTLGGYVLFAKILGVVLPAGLFGF